MTTDHQQGMNHQLIEADIAYPAIENQNQNLLAPEIKALKSSIEAAAR